nr:hypothetical protein [Tanacetum cinerariifolium]
MNQNFNYSNSFSFDQIQPQQQFVNHQPQEIPEVIPFIKSKEWIETKNELYKMMKAYTERMNQQREQEALLAAQREQELREQEQAAQRKQKLLAQKQAAQEKEEPLQNSDFRKLIEEMYGIKASAEQKQKLEETMLELLELCREKELYCVHDSIEDLIGRAMNTMLLSINLKSQRLEVKNVTPDLPIKEPEYSLSMGDEHLSTIPKTESDEVIKYSVKNLVPIPSESEIYSKPLFDDEEIISTKIEEADFDLEEEIRFVENFSYDNSSARPPKELNVEIADTILESLSPSPILIEDIQDNDSQREEIDIVSETDELLPPRIESDNYDSEGDIHFLEELLVDNSIPSSENELSNFDHQDDPLFPRPPPEPPDVEFNFEPNSREVISAVTNDNDELECFDPGEEINVFANIKDDDYFPFLFVIRIFLPYLIYLEVSPSLLSAESEDTIFDPGISD